MLGRALIACCALLGACTQRSPAATSAWPTTPGFEACGFTLSSGASRTWSACAKGPAGCTRLAGSGFGRSTSKGVMLVTRHQSGPDHFRLSVGPIEGAEFLVIEGAPYPRSQCAVIEADVSDEGIVIAVSRPVDAQSIEVAYFHAPLGPVTASMFQRPAAILPAGAFDGAMFSGAVWVDGAVVTTGGGKIIRGAGGFTEWIKGSVCCTASLGAGELLYHRDESPSSAWVKGSGSPALLYRAKNHATPLVPAGDVLVWFEEVDGKIDLFTASLANRPLVPHDVGNAGVDALPIEIVTGNGAVGFRTGPARFRVVRLVEGRTSDHEIERLAFIEPTGIGVVRDGALERWPAGK